MKNGYNMQKIIHKLNQEIRKKIAAAYVADKFSYEMNDLNSQYNAIADRLFLKCKTLINYDDLINLEDFVINNNYYFSMFTKFKDMQGLLLTHYGRKSNPRNLKLPLYVKNEFYLVCGENYIYLKNKNVQPTIIDYSSLLCKIENIEGLYNINDKIDEFSVKTINRSFNEVYELLKKVNTVEQLLKHWSNAYKYLPEDIITEEPKSLSLSEKFSML